MKEAAEFPASLPRVGQVIRFVAQDQRDKEVINTVEALVVARYWCTGTLGFNLTTSCPEYRDLEWDGPGEGRWGFSRGLYNDGTKSLDDVLELEIIE
jgi:hypothetical protein